MAAKRLQRQPIRKAPQVTRSLCQSLLWNNRRRCRASASGCHGTRLRLTQSEREQAPPLWIPESILPPIQIHLPHIITNRWLHIFLGQGRAQHRPARLHMSAGVRLCISFTNYRPSLARRQPSTRWRPEACRLRHLSLQLERVWRLPPKHWYLLKCARTWRVHIIGRIQAARCKNRWSASTITRLCPGD